MIKKKLDDNLKPIKYISPRFSFWGFNAFEWLKGNKEAVKLVVSALFGLWIPTTPELKILSAACLKLTLDSIDFFTSNVELK